MEAKYLKELALEMRGKPTWDKDELEGRIIKKIEQCVKDVDKPKVDAIHLYDFVRVFLHGVPHPCVIFRQEEDCVWGILVSKNNKGCHNVSPIEGSRVLKGGFWTNTIICEPKHEAIKNWLGMFDNPSDVSRAMGLLRAYYENILK